MSKKKFVDTDIKELLKNKKAKRTIYQENTAFSAFNDFLQYKNLNVDLKTLSYKELDIILRDFYASLRNGDSLYKRNTYLATRQALKRKLKIIVDNSLGILRDTNLGIRSVTMKTLGIKTRKLVLIP